MSFFEQFLALMVLTVWALWLRRRDGAPQPLWAIRIATALLSVSVITAGLSLPSGQNGPSTVFRAAQVGGQVVLAGTAVALLVLTARGKRS